MARRKQKKFRRRETRPVDLKCFFCEKKVEPDYKKSKILEKFITGRGKIVGRSNTGLCQKHQRRLKIAIKRARFLSLLPFAKQV